MIVTVRIRRKGYPVHDRRRPEGDRVSVSAGWYERVLPLGQQLVFCPRQTGHLEGGGVNAADWTGPVEDRVATLFVRVLAVADADL